MKAKSLLITALLLSSILLFGCSSSSPETTDKGKLNAEKTILLLQESLPTEMHQVTFTNSLEDVERIYPSLAKEDIIDFAALLPKEGSTTEIVLVQAKAESATKVKEAMEKRQQERLAYAKENLPEEVPKTEYTLIAQEEDQLYYATSEQHIDIVDLLQKNWLTP